MDKNLSPFNTTHTINPIEIAVSKAKMDIVNPGNPCITDKTVSEKQMP